MKRKTYEIWIGFINYTGAVNDKNLIAVFYSENRANEYLNFCMEDNDPLVTYWIETK